jgi:hypothetical protein
LVCGCGGEGMRRGEVSEVAETVEPKMNGDVEE